LANKAKGRKGRGEVSQKRKRKGTVAARSKGEIVRAEKESVATEVEPLAPVVPPAKRVRAALEAQAFLRGTIRARLRRVYPDLDAREIMVRYFQEITRNGGNK
jgi:hypothetical protein